MGNGKCKGICTRYKAKKLVGQRRYEQGQRHCKQCDIFIKWEGIWCPCCGNRIKTKARFYKVEAKNRCKICNSTASLRGPSSMWFENGTVCINCYIRQNKMFCNSCKSEILMKDGKKPLIITKEGEVLCRPCYARTFKPEEQVLVRKITKGLDLLFANEICPKMA